MKTDLSSVLQLRVIMLPVIFLLFMRILDAKPIDYEDVENLLPTEPQTTNDTLAAIIQDPVVQDAVQNAVGNGSLQGLVVKKKVLVIPAIEPTKVVSQREQVLVVPMTHLEDVRKNITKTVIAEDNIDDQALMKVQSFGNKEDEYASLVNHDGITDSPSQQNDFYKLLTDIPTRKLTLSVDTPQEVTVPIIAFLDPVGIADNEARQDDIPKNQLNLLENEQIRRNVQDHIDGNSWSTDLGNGRRASPTLEIQTSSSLEPATVETQYINDINSDENSLPLVMDIATPLFWTADADDNYPKNLHDMEVAADIVFRPLFRYRQEAQQKSYRRSAYRRYNSYSKRNYRYKSRYSNDYYY